MKSSERLLVDVGHSVREDSGLAERINLRVDIFMSEHVPHHPRHTAQDWLYRANEGR